MKNYCFIRFFSIIIMFTAGLDKSYAQNYQMNKIIPASPTATALGKYGNVPVSFYNGTPNISIPIYDISTTNHSLKIAMSYDASGIKAQQDASWVGLGWSLSAGGVITKTVRQQDDFLEHGYYRAATLPADPSSTDNATLLYLNDVYNGYTDAEPDIYSYNFNGYSGRFTLGKKADGAPVFQDEKNNLKIQYLDDQGKWQITTGEGYKYFFSTTESAQDYNKHTLYEFTDINGVQGLNMDVSGAATTGWYLDSIVAPNGETISFTYLKGKSLSMITRGETYYQLNRILEEGQGLCSPQFPPTSHHYDVSRQALNDVYLKTITFATGSIEFNTTPRLDMEYLNNNDGLLTPSKLDNIIIRNNSGTMLKKFMFNYTYFGGAGNTSNRLKLDGITEYGSNGAAKPSYLFSYINPNSLPNKASKLIDHWGYENDKPNLHNTLLPTATFTEAAQSFDGADRSADTLQVLPANGVLNRITYPTGGSTAFEYELNDYSNLHDGEQYQTVNRFEQARTNAANHDHDVQEVNFTIHEVPGNPSQKIPVNITCSALKVDGDASDVRLGYSNMWQVRSDGTLKAISGCDNLSGNVQGGYEYSKNLDPGNYRMYVQAGQGWSYAMTMTWQEKTLATVVAQRKGGGIRVKRIVDEDALGHANVRRYQYTDNTGKSSGVLLTYPLYNVTYVSYITTSFQDDQGNKTVCRFLASYNMLSSSSLYVSGLSSRSGIVGYSKITELLGDNGENGRTEYNFHSQEEPAYNFPGIPVASDPLNGKLDSVKTYRAQNVLVKQEINHYTVQQNDFVGGIKLFYNYSTLGPANGYNDYNYYPKAYNIQSYWTVNDQKKETVFNAGKPITTTTNYTYGNSTHREISQMAVNKSDGSQLITTYTRPGDYLPGNGSSFAEQMLSDYVIAPVIEQRTLIVRNGALRLISGTFTNYQKYNNSFWRPNLVCQLEAPAPLSDLTQSSFTSAGAPVIHPNYKPAAYFDKYDQSSGVLLSRHLADGSPSAYFWGYGNQYPVAEVKGIDYITASQYVDPILLNNPSTTAGQMRTEINKIRTAVAGTNNQVSTFTFMPLVGMTSSVDAKNLTTTYEYDNFQRLINVKDKDGNIVKHTDYHYQGQ